MKILLKLEELSLFGFSILLFGQLDYAWWLYPAVLLLPDISIAGYIGGSRAGAIIYNCIHHKALAIGIYCLGLFLGNSLLKLAGVILLGHTSLDRTLGYGLKYSESFSATHLGVIGQAKNDYGKTAWR